jgi:hypothetical protein
MASSSYTCLRTVPGRNIGAVLPMSLAFMLCVAIHNPIVWLQSNQRDGNSMGKKTVDLGKY